MNKHNYQALVFSSVADALIEIPIMNHQEYCPEIEINIWTMFSGLVQMLQEKVPMIHSDLSVPKSEYDS